VSDLTLPTKIMLRNGRKVECAVEPSDTGYQLRFEAEDGNALDLHEHAENLLAVCHHLNMVGKKVAIETHHSITPIPMTRAEQAKHRSDLNKALMAAKPMPWWVRLVMKLTVWVAVIGIIADAITGDTPWYKAVAYIATILIIVPCLVLVMQEKGGDK